MFNPFHQSLVPESASCASPHLDLLSLPTFRAVARLEAQYREAIGLIPKDPDSLLALDEKLQRRFFCLCRQVRFLQRNLNAKDTVLRGLLEKYLKELTVIHEKNRFGIILYCDLCWPADDASSLIDRKRRQRWKGVIHGQALELWEDLKKGGGELRLSADKLNLILSLKNDMESGLINSPAWRMSFQELAQMIFDIAAAQLRQGRYAFKNRFAIVMASAGVFLPQAHLQDMIGSGPESERAIAQSRQLLLERITDWILGYIPVIPRSGLKILQQASEQLTPRFRKMETRIRRSKILRGSLLLGSVLALGLFLHVSKGDVRMTRVIVYEMKRFFQMDQDALGLKKRKEFFRWRLLHAAQDYSPEKLREDLQFFKSAGLYRTDQGYFYFADNILKGFFLLLPNWDLEQEIKTEIIQAADLLNPRLSATLKNIVNLYGQKTIGEKSLKLEMLRLRRIFVNHNTFPFMFLVLENDIPHIFLFPERIVMRILLAQDVLERLGMAKDMPLPRDSRLTAEDAPGMPGVSEAVPARGVANGHVPRAGGAPANFPQINQREFARCNGPLNDLGERCPQGRPLTNGGGQVHNTLHRANVWAYLVQGDRYPFKDRAGYFEGEFAVIFKTMASQLNWTVFHEIGHVIDFYRLKHSGTPIPKNVELNAMLMPMIFHLTPDLAKNQDRKEYVNGRLVPEAMKADVHDYYSQAAKGILNGIAIYLAPAKEPMREQLISNRFEPERIKNIADQAAKLSSKELRNMGFEFFKDPEKYLSTAGAGRYASFISNAEEIVYGAPHGVEQRGFILGGRGLIGARHGPRFIREGEGDASEVPFDLLTFLSNVLSIIFLPRSSLAQATEGEAAAAAVMVFILFNSLSLVLHKLGTPIRKKLFYGRALADIIDHIYADHPWSVGLSFGAELKERKLLRKVFAANQGAADLPGQRLKPLAGEAGSPRDSTAPDGDDDQIKQQAATFKAMANEHQRLLFDVCLCLAPVNPRRSRIVNRMHDVLFYLPFLGPRLGRSITIWPVQRAFHQREAYNRDIEALAKGIKQGKVEPHQATGVPVASEAVVERLGRIYENYAVPGSPAPAEAEAHDFGGMEEKVFQFLTEENRVCHLNFKFLSDHLPQYHEVSQEFERLDEYYAGDDIRRIDWKATARTPTFRPLVRRYSTPYGIKIGFWLDLRYLKDGKARQQWAKDFVHSVNMFHMLGEESVLERLIFVLRDGNVREEVVNIRTHRDEFDTAQKIMAKTREKFKAMTDQRKLWLARGLKFYTQEENTFFRQITDLTDFGSGVQNIRREPLQAKRMNIFLVGATMDNIEDITEVVGKENKIFSWAC